MPPGLPLILEQLSIGELLMLDLAMEPGQIVRVANRHLRIEAGGLVNRTTSEASP
ncbi:hypothetical protein ACPF7Z_13415 [Halomonas sp. GXIMD04776]|uniref:hypothetical protein n=1 Tax=Halomonas sp. GXIMD04776 TaxID=3415605 RepID=UPI003CC08D4E